jgi:hypothetical protein
MTEECRRRLDLRDDGTLWWIVLWKRDGDTNAEIALRLGCVESTVERKLQRIHRCWRREGGHGHKDAG